MVIFQNLLLKDKRVISKERNTVRASYPHASLTWTDNTSKVGYAGLTKIMAFYEQQIHIVKVLFSRDMVMYLLCISLP